MTADPVLTLGWLALAHLAADFVFQTDGVAAAKSASGPRAARGLAIHVTVVFVCLVPVVLAFGLPGLVATTAISAAHAVIDRLKVVLTRRSEAAALRAVRDRGAREPSEPEAGLGAGWTPVPAALFALDQLAHGGVLAFAWLTWLASEPLAEPFTSAVTSVVGRWDPELVHRVTLTAVVLVGLAIVNVRAATFFVAILVHPREAVTGGSALDGDPTWRPDQSPPRPSRTAWTVRLGPLRATVEGGTEQPGSAFAPGGAGDAGEAGEAGDARGGPARDASEIRPAARAHGLPPAHTPSPTRVGATIGVLERLLIVAFMLTGAQAAVGFVVAAKTIARFRQLDDRNFAEYYLLGTLASVTVALGSALVAGAMLATVA